MRAPGSIKYVLAFSAALAVGGCGAQAWRKDGTSEAEYNRDLRDCQSRAHAVGMNSPIEFFNFLEGCLRAEGWRPG